MKKLIPVFILLTFLACAKEEGEPLVPPPGQAYRTQYNSMQIVGDFQGWNLNDYENTKMTLVADYKWERLIRFNAPQDSIRFKFVANRDWNYAFGTPGADTGLAGYAQPNCNGFGDHITAGPITKAGYWKFEFNENTLFYRISLVSTSQGKIYGWVRFEDVLTPPYPIANVDMYVDTVRVRTNTDTLGYYEFSNVDDGTYKLKFTATGYAPESTFVTVSNWASVRVDTVTLKKAINIVIDGDLSDWPVGPVVQDTIGDSPWGLDGDLGALYVYHDRENLYLGAVFAYGGTYGNGNPIIFYLNVNNDNPNDGATRVDSLDWNPKKFIFPDSTPVEYILYKAPRPVGVAPALRHVLSKTATEPVPTTDYEAQVMQISGNIHSIEAKIPLRVMYGQTVPAGAKVRVVVVIAGDGNWNGPESLPENAGMTGTGTLTLLENMYIESLSKKARKK